MRFSTSTIFAGMLATLTTQVLGASSYEHDARHLSKRAVNANTQSCTATDSVDILTGNNIVFYNTDIGLDFNNGAGCNAINNALGGMLSSQGFANFQCNDDGGGFTLVKFSVNQATGNGATIDTVFQSVTNNQIQGGFNCPDF